MTEPKDLAVRWIDEIFNASAFDILDDVVATDFVEHALAPFGSSAPGSVDGPVHTKQVIERLRAQFPDLVMTVDAVIAEGDLVSARVTASGTNRGPLNGVIPPTGRSFVVQQCHWFRIDRGRIVEHWAVRDDLGTMLQLGVVPSAGVPR